MKKNLTELYKLLKKEVNFFFLFFHLVNLVIFIIRFVCKKNRKNITTCNIID